MNINQEDVRSQASEVDNNISAGTSATQQTTGCSSCNDSTVGSLHADVAELPFQVDTSTKDSVIVTDKGPIIQQVQSRDLPHNPEADGNSGLGTASNELDVEVNTHPEGDPETKGGQHHQKTENNTHQTAGVCCEWEPDYLTKGERIMRNCSCDEGSLCYCPSSVFKESRDHAVRSHMHKNLSNSVSSSDSNSIKQQGGEMDAEKIVSKKEAVPLEDEEDVRQCKKFMEDLVDRIFNNSASICQEDNAKFGEYCQLAIGRQWFARLVDSQRVNCKKVTEQTFYRLVQFFAVCLFECNDADDFTPGKSLMNMCFTFYHEHEGFPRCDDTIQKSFLYSHLTEQPIWKSARFWNAAFFDAVHQERKKRQPDDQVNWRHLTTEERESTELLNENITFGQLATFLHNMMELELSLEICQQFLDKMATIGNLSSDQKDLIQTNIGQHFQEEIEENTKNKRQHHHKPFNKLYFMKRKVGREAMS